LREQLFRVCVWLKGLDGALELAGGAALYPLTPAFIVRAVAFLTHDEIAEDPRDFVANALRRAAAHLALSGEHFMALYLLVHGAVKVGLVAALLRRKLLAFPAAIVVFAAFIGYQLYRFTITHGAGLVALSAFDACVVGLIWLEYRALCSAAGTSPRRDS